MGWDWLSGADMQMVPVCQRLHQGQNFCKNVHDQSIAELWQTGREHCEHALDKKKNEKSQNLNFARLFARLAAIYLICSANLYHYFCRYALKVCNPQTFSCETKL